MFCEKSDHKTVKRWIEMSNFSKDELMKIVLHVPKYAHYAYKKLSDENYLTNNDYKTIIKFGKSELVLHEILLSVIESINKDMIIHIYNYACNYLNSSTQNNEYTYTLQNIRLESAKKLGLEKNIQLCEKMALISMGQEEAKDLTIDALYCALIDSNPTIYDVVRIVQSVPEKSNEALCYMIEKWSDDLELVVNTITHPRIETKYISQLAEYILNLRDFNASYALHNRINYLLTDDDIYLERKVKLQDILINCMKKINESKQKIAIEELVLYSLKRELEKNI